MFHGELGLVDGVFVIHAGGLGSDSPGSTCLNNFSHPTDQDICTHYALSLKKIVVSEWLLVILVSLDVGDGLPPNQTRKTIVMCIQDTHTLR